MTSKSQFVSQQRSMHKMSAEQLEYEGLSDQLMEPYQLDELDEPDENGEDEVEYVKDDTRDDDNDYDRNDKWDKMWGPSEPSPDKDVYQSIRGHAGGGRIIPNTERPVLTTLRNRSKWFRGLAEKNVEFWFKMRVSSMRREMAEERSRQKRFPNSVPQKDWDYDLILRAAREDATKLNANFFNHLTTNTVYENRRPPELLARKLVPYAKKESYADMKRRLKTNGVHYGEAENPGPSDVLLTRREYATREEAFSAAVDILSTLMWGWVRTKPFRNFMCFRELLRRSVLRGRYWSVRVGLERLTVDSTVVSTHLSEEWVEPEVFISIDNMCGWYPVDDTMSCIDCANHNPMCGHRIGEASNPGPSDGPGVMPCVKGACSRAKHWHRKHSEGGPKPPSDGAQRRIEQKVKLCKFGDLELCPEGVECYAKYKSAHYHIGDGRLHTSDGIESSLENEIERLQGIADADEELSRVDEETPEVDSVEDVDEELITQPSIESLDERFSRIFGSQSQASSVTEDSFITQPSLDEQQSTSTDSLTRFIENHSIGTSTLDAFVREDFFEEDDDDEDDSVSSLPPVEAPVEVVSPPQEPEEVLLCLLPAVPDYVVDLNEEIVTTSVWTRELGRVSNIPREYLSEFVMDACKWVVRVMFYYKEHHLETDSYKDSIASKFLSGRQTTEVKPWGVFRLLLNKFTSSDDVVADMEREMYDYSHTAEIFKHLADHLRSEHSNMTTIKIEDNKKEYLASVTARLFDTTRTLNKKYFHAQHNMRTLMTIGFVINDLNMKQQYAYSFESNKLSVNGAKTLSKRTNRAVYGSNFQL